MSGRLAGETALVTAAGQGIGRAIATAFAREGARVIATDREPDLLADLGLQGNIVVEALDVLDAGAILDCAARFNDVSVLASCAGLVHNGTILECPEEDWARSVDLNLTAMYRLIRAFLPAMVEQRQGSILTISSVASSISGVPNRFVYGTTKAGVIGLTKAVAADFVANNVRANAICPGTIETPSLQQRMAATGDVHAARQAFVARQPMGRLGTAEEVAELAVYLASRESAFTTGAVHVIDGGWTM